MTIDGPFFDIVGWCHRIEVLLTVICVVVSISMIENILYWAREWYRADASSEIEEDDAELAELKEQVEKLTKAVEALRP